MFFDLPEDIVKLIYEFSAEHRENFEKTLNRIPMALSFDSLHHVAIGKRALNIVKKYDDKCFETGNYNFQEVIESNVDDIDRFMTVYKRCRCCKHHVEQKKCIVIPKEPKTNYVRPLSATYFNEGENCTCNCHTMLSFMSKMKNNSFTIHDHYSTKWHNYHLMSDESDEEDDDDAMSLISFGSYS